MVPAGLLIVSNFKNIAATLNFVKKYVQTLYIHLDIPTTILHPLPSIGTIISHIYVEAANQCVATDLRILVSPLRDQRAFSKLNIKPIDMLFTDSEKNTLAQQLSRQFQRDCTQIKLCSGNETIPQFDPFQNMQKTNVDCRTFESVVLGGTFDRIHLGHKIFLTQAVIRASKRLVVGVTAECMNKNKILSELILPVEERIKDVRNFLTEIDSSLQYEIVAIEDPFGPTKCDPNLDLIVVSAETMRGGHKVNEIRCQNKLKELEIHCIEMVNKETNDQHKESKISSSNARIDLLGTRLRQPEPKPHLPKNVYIIGLTGGIASGKTQMRERLEKLGAVVFDCDKIAHEAYEPGQSAYKKLIEHFGQNIVSSDGRIDRRKLGEIVFSDKNQLDSLNNIVWPEILLEVKRRIERIQNEQCGKMTVIVIEAAVLIKAGWDTECHEVWSMIINREVAIERIMERNKLSQEEATKRINSQLTNKEIVAKSNVVFSSYWEPEFTQQQTEKAWRSLMWEIDPKSSPI